MSGSESGNHPTSRRLLVVSYEHPPCPGIGGARWMSMTRYLRELGHSVVLVASSAWGDLVDDAGLGVTRVGDLRSARAFRFVLRRGKLRREGDRDLLEKPPGRILTHVLVPDMNVATWLPQATFVVRRLLASQRYDCLITTSPPESSHLLGLSLGDLRPAWVADFRDGWTFEPLRTRFPTAVQRRFDAHLERRVALSAEVAVGATRPIADDLSKRLGAFAACVSNGWDPDTAPLPHDDAHGSQGAGITLVYTGTLTVRGDPEPLMRALRAVSNESGSPRLKLLHAGRLTTREKQLIERSGVAGVVEHLGTLDRSGALALQRSADALVLLTSRNRSEATGKLFEYLFAGRPIVALAEGTEAGRIVQETNTGIVVPQDDVDAIAAALRRVASGELAQKYAPRDLDRYAYPRPAEQMAELIEEAIRRRAAARASDYPEGLD